MRNRLSVALAALACAFVNVSAQAPSRGAAPARASTTTTSSKLDADLLQLMRGTLYPASNVLFAAQDDLSKQPPASDAATSPNPLTSTYGGWAAVENAGLAIAETSRLLTIPGRMCSSGRPAPIASADWIRFTVNLRKAGLAAYEAAKKKSTDAMVDVSGTVSDACQACHDKYREEKGGLKDRCLP